MASVDFEKEPNTRQRINPTRITATMIATIVKVSITFYLETNPFALRRSALG